MLRLASLVEKHREQLAELESRDNGKPQHVANAVDIGCASPTRPQAHAVAPGAVAGMWLGVAVGLTVVWLGGTKSVWRLRCVFGASHRANI